MSARVSVVHWSGGARWKDARGWSNTAGPGYPICCSGQKAQDIARRGNQSATDVSVVSCMPCIRNLRAAGLLPDEPGTTHREDLRLLESLAADLLTTDSRLSEAVTRAMEALEKAGAR